MLRELVGGAGCTGGRKKSGWGVSWTIPPRAFGINADQWTTAAQDEGEWCETAEQKGRNEIDGCRESQGWTTYYNINTACSGSIILTSSINSTPERDGKNQGNTKTIFL